jgi:hypothetical protein
MVDHIRLGPDGKIQEFTVFMRPLPAAAAALRLIGAPGSVGERAWPGPPLSLPSLVPSRS